MTEKRQNDTGVSRTARRALLASWGLSGLTAGAGHLLDLSQATGFAAFLFLLGLSCLLADAARRSVAQARTVWVLLTALLLQSGLLSGLQRATGGDVALDITEVPLWVLTLMVSMTLTSLTAVVVQARARTPQHSHGPLLDLGIVVVGAVPALHATLVRPLLERQLGFVDVVTAALPVTSALLSVGAVLWMLLLPGRRLSALGWELLATVSIAMGTAISAISPDLGSTPAVAVPLAMGLLSYGVAATRRSAPEICEPAHTARAGFGPGRMATFGAALLLTPVTAVAEYERFGTIDPVLVLAPMAVIGALVLVRMRGMYADVQRSEAHVVERETYTRMLLENVSDLMFVTGYDGTISYRNPAAALLFGPDGIDTIVSRIPTDEQERLGGMVELATANPGETIHGVTSLEDVSGDVRRIEVALTDMTSLLGHEGLMWLLHDVTDRVRLEDELRHQALHDSLTGLPNRALAADRLSHVATRARRDGAECAVLFVDLDDFKAINDNLGHVAGDFVLVTVADRLRGAVRQGDTVGRLGGDEFAVIAEDVGGEADALADRIRVALSQPIEVFGTKVAVTASIGIAVGIPNHPGQLLHDADVAMYQAKAAGKDFAMTFEEGMQQTGADRLALEMDLLAAVDATDQLELHYQPLVDLTALAPIGVEALLRWHHPTRGLVPPDEFIPLAEDVGLISAIGRRVLLEACAQGAAWQSTQPGLTMSVNLSVRQLEQPTLVDDVAAALTASGLDPQLLVVELTESAMIRDLDVAVARLRALKALGVRIAMDDFGTGYSSLASLRALPIDVLKIDRSLVSGAAHGEEVVPDARDSGAILAALVEMGQVLGLEVVAEGVETQEELELLRSLGCDTAQGYLLSRPMPALSLDQLWALTKSRTAG